jgi:hypothetical protein
MNRRTRLLLGAAVIVAVALFALERLERPKRVRSAFLGHLYHQRYAEAAAMLVAPSSVEHQPTGGLKVIAEDGTSKVVPASQLPFKAGGARSLADDQFGATALGPSTAGVLDSPAVSLRLSPDGDRVRIVSVDS